MKKTVLIIIAVVFLSMNGCGYFLYPERVGQKSGKLDLAIVALDAAALLFGIVPGIVAFAVDITTGAIYLTPGQKSVIEKHSRNMALMEREKLRPAEKTEICIDQKETAHRLSLILGQAIDADQIEYYKSEAAKARVIAIPTKS